MNDVKPSLKAVLKRLKLSGLVPVLPDRAAYGSKASLTPMDVLWGWGKLVRISTLTWGKLVRTPGACS